VSNENIMTYMGKSNGYVKKQSFAVSRYYHNIHSKGMRKIMESPDKKIQNWYVLRASQIQCS